MEENEFIGKLKDLVSSRLYDQKLGSEDLAREGLTSRASLYRKLKKLVNQTANGFIHQQRFEEATRLLANEPGRNISEISEKVGFKDLSYFSRKFKQHFGISPMKYRSNKAGKIGGESYE